MLGCSSKHFACDPLLPRDPSGSDSSHECVLYSHRMFVCGDNAFQVLVSGWSDNGWLSGGHAVRMAMELCQLPFSSSVDPGLTHVTALHKAWPKLLRRMQNKSKGTDGSEDRDLVISSRTWFCLYLFEHQ